MSKDKEMFNDLIEIFDEEHGKRNLITPQNTAEKLIVKGYRKASEGAREIFEEIDRMCIDTFGNFNHRVFAELKKKYTDGEE